MIQTLSVSAKEQAFRFPTERADELTRKLSAFDSFEDLLRGSHDGTVTGYRPSLTRRNADNRELADLYDQAQQMRGDKRRAYRG